MVGFTKVIQINKDWTFYFFVIQGFVGTVEGNQSETFNLGLERDHCKV